MLSCTLKCTDSCLQLSDSEMMARQLRACTVLAEDPSSVPSTRIRKLTPHLLHLLGSAVGHHGTCRHTCTFPHTDTYIYTRIKVEHIFKTRKLSMVLLIRNSCLEQLRVKLHWGVAQQQSTCLAYLRSCIHSQATKHTKNFSKSMNELHNFIKICEKDRKVHNE